MQTKNAPNSNNLNRKEGGYISTKSIGKIALLAGLLLLSMSMVVASAVRRPDPPPPEEDQLLKLVFVTSTTYGVGPGADRFNGIVHANEICTKLAHAANLQGDYRAWLSDTHTSPRSSWTASGPWHSTCDGNPLVAGSVAELMGAFVPLESPIKCDQYGAEVAGDFSVWTNTEDDGQEDRVIGTTDERYRRACGNWISPNPPQTRVGDLRAVDDHWSEDTFVACDGSYRLYCFQQRY
jgi:hypothetical protein